MDKHHRFRPLAVGLLVISTVLAGALVAAPASATSRLAAGSGLTLVTAASPLDSASSKEALAQCPRGTRVLGGGGFLRGGGRQVHFIRLQALGSSDRFAAGAAENGAYAADWRVYAYGICGRAPAGLEYATFQSARNSTEFKQVHALCTPGKRLVSAGARIHGGNGDVVLRRFVPGQDVVEVEAIEDEDGYHGDWTVWAHGVCADPLPGWKLVSSTTPADSDDKVNSVVCPAGKQVYGFGSAMTGVPGTGLRETIYAGAYPDAGLTAATTISLEDATGTGDNWYTSLVAVCAT